ncbi:MAG TPA: EamA family transporter [Mycobacteriales bacterium]|nr:EamA family transporter [Mycobacteriales bacterium]
MRRVPLVPAPVLVLGAVTSVQSGAAVATKLFPAVGPVGAVFLRLLLAGALLVGVARPRARAVGRSPLLLAVLFGVALAAMNCSFYLAIDRIPLGVAVTIEFLGPLSVAIAGSRRRLDLVWVVFAAAGVALLAGGGGRLDAVGLLLAAVAGGFWAAYILLSQRVGRAIPGMAGLAIAMTVGAVAVAPWGIVSGGRALVRPTVFGRGLAVAVLSSAIPYSLELMALRRLAASVFGILMSLEPAVAALSGLAFLGQRLVWHEWVAIGCVMVASVGATSQAEQLEPVEVTP